MGIFDSVLGAVTGGQAASGAGRGGGLLGMVTANPQLLQAVTGMLANDGPLGGLSGIVEKFKQAGLGDVIASWVGNGENLPISGSQLSDVLGQDAISGLAGKLGVSSGEAATQLSGILPGLINQLTPQGQTPSGGLGNAGDLMGMLGGLLKKG